MLIDLKDTIVRVNDAILYDILEGNISVTERDFSLDARFRGFKLLEDLSPGIRDTRKVTVMFGQTGFVLNNVVLHRCQMWSLQELKHLRRNYFNCNHSYMSMEGTYGQ